MREHHGFVYIQWQSEQMAVFMLGRDNAALAELGRMWSQSKEQAREGLIFAID
jgi:hypothetical protein